MVLNFLKIFIAIITYVFSLTNFEYVDYLKFYIKLYIRSECSYPLSNAPLINFIKFWSLGGELDKGFYGSQYKAHIKFNYKKCIQINKQWVNEFYIIDVSLNLY